MSDYHANLPIGTRVQAVWSDDGEWYVKKIVMSEFHSNCVLNFSFPFVLPLVSCV
jgi:hypothetical protein